MSPIQNIQPRTGHRRALSHIGGPVESSGREEYAVRLVGIMGCDVDDDAARMHVHGFHSYPARMHPTVARRSVELLSSPSDILLDPFCGSGTVLVESRLAGRKCWGADINPLAVLLARLKTRGASTTELRALVTAARTIAEHADRRRREKRGASQRYSSEDVELFDPHVLLELDGLRDGILAETFNLSDDDFVHQALRLVLSSILIKVSRKPGDTSTTHVPRRLAAGYTISLFENKALELADRIYDFCKRLPRGAPIAKVREGDARLLESIPNRTVRLVLSSPPYAGTYDYVDQHRLRCRWLGLNADGMQRSEVGARRHFRPMQHSDAVRRYRDDLVVVLTTLRHKLARGGLVLLLVADSVVSSTVESRTGPRQEWEPVWVEPMVRRCGEDAGLAWVATASQVRPHYHAPSRHAFGRQPRREHLVLLRPADAGE